MCEPISLTAAIGLGLSAVGTAAAVAGSMQQGAAQKKQADYQAQVARNNQTVAAQNAQAAQNQAEVRAQAVQRAGDMKLSAQRAALGASGVGLDSGSALDVTGATAQQTALSVDQEAYQGRLSAYGYGVQGSNYAGAAQMAEASGQSAGSSSYLNAAGSLLGGASQVAGKWSAWSKAGGAGGYGYEGAN